MNKHCKTLIGEVMTPCPHSIGLDQELIVARKMLRKYGFRHLPVQDGGRLVGIISDRDITFALAVEKDKSLAFDISDIYTPDPYLVEPECLLSEAVNYMWSEKIGCALIVKDGKLAGIFTTADACRVLGSILEGRGVQTHCGCGCEAKAQGASSSSIA